MLRGTSQALGQRGQPNQRHVWMCARNPCHGTARKRPEKIPCMKARPLLIAVAHVAGCTETGRDAGGSDCGGNENFAFTSLRASAL
jgi:hypothetical protein